MDNGIKNLEKDLVTRIPAERVIHFIIEYLKRNDERINILELMARMNLWSKDTLRVCGFMLDRRLISADNNIIIINNKETQKFSNHNDIKDLMKSNFKYKTKHKFSKVEIQLLNKYKSAIKGRPKNNSKLDQFYCTSETNMERLRLALNEKNCKQKSVCFMGDDDLTSLIFAMSGKFKYVGVFDVDKKLLGFLNMRKRELNIRNYNIFYHDYTKPFSSRYKFDIFFSDPPATIDAVDLVLGRAKEISKSKSTFFLSWADFLWDCEYKHLINNVYKKSGWIKTRGIPKFNEYENECMLEYLTQRDWDIFKSFSITVSDLNSSPPIQRYGITRLILNNEKKTKLGVWNKDIYLDESKIKRIKEMRRML